MDPLDAQIRQVFFFDTPDLALNEQGVVVRARRVQGKRGDCVVKLRPVVPEEMPKAPAPVAQLQRRARCHAGRPRLLGHAQEPRRQRRGQGGRSRRAAAGEAPLEAPARLPGRAHARRTRARRPLAPRPDPGDEAEVRAEGIRPAAGRRALDVPRRLAGVRALHEVRAAGRLQRRRGDARVPVAARHRPRRASRRRRRRRRSTSSRRSSGSRRVYVPLDGMARPTASDRRARCSRASTASSTRACTRAWAQSRRTATGSGSAGTGSGTGRASTGASHPRGAIPTFASSRHTSSRRCSSLTSVPRSAHRCRRPTATRFATAGGCSSTTATSPTSISSGAS